MAEFKPFRRLPAELKLRIWRMALEEESKHGRLVLMNDWTYTITPTRQLISPFLTANKLAREVALGSGFYPTKLDVSYQPVDGDAKSKGALYLNVQRSTFYLHYHKFRSGSKKSIWEEKILGWNYPSLWDVTPGYTTNPLSTDLRAEIENIRAMRAFVFRGEPLCCWECSYSDRFDEEGTPVAMYYRQTYPNIKSCRLVILKPYTEGAEFMQDFSTMGATEFSKEWNSRYVTCEFEV
ncbi:hypothetical protein DL765_010552 [Monosporascus sp. GIB2]|nr:hypothetical protein DL765_010552 [Monosporascus sp. GIB2]